MFSSGAPHPYVRRRRDRIAASTRLRSRRLRYFLVALTLLTAVALVTRDPADPIETPIWPINVFYQPDQLVYPSNESVSNACGYWGALIAAVMLDATGIACALIVAAGGGISVSLLIRGRSQCAGVAVTRWNDCHRRRRYRCGAATVLDGGDAGHRRRRIPGRDDLDLVAGALPSDRCVDINIDGDRRRIVADDRLRAGVRRERQSSRKAPKSRNPGCTERREPFRFRFVVNGNRTPTWIPPSRSKGTARGDKKT